MINMHINRIGCEKMNKLVFFKALEKAVKDLPVDDQRMIIKEYEYRYQQEKMKGNKDKQIIASFGSPTEIVEAYLASKKSEVHVNLNSDLVVTNTSNDYKIAKEGMKLGAKEETTTETTKVKHNPTLEIEVPVKEETGVEEEKEEKEETKEEAKEKSKKEYKKIKPGLIPLWLLLIVLMFVLCVSLSLLYIPLVLLGVGIIIFAAYVIAGSIVIFMGGNIFQGLFQVGIGILIMILGVLFISLTNLMVKGIWKALVIMFKKIGGKK